MYQKLQHTLQGMWPAENHNYVGGTCSNWHNVVDYMISHDVSILPLHT